VDRFPTSARVPDAMLKIGYLQQEMGAREQAMATLAEVIARFPGSRVAISADARLKQLQREGNSR
jgi:TolA-binding protein